MAVCCGWIAAQWVSSRVPVSEEAKLHPAGESSADMSTLATTSIVPPPIAPVTNWYALYTAPRHEKFVADQMDRQGISCFLPLYRSVRRWKDRRKELAMVLFPGYV